MQRTARIVLRTLAALGSLFLSLYGVYAYSGLNLNLDTLPTSLYCFLPMISFPLFLLSIWVRRWSVAMQWSVAAVYLIDYSALNWRTCSELGYCSSVAATVWMTFATRPVVILFAVALANHIAVHFSRMGSSAPGIAKAAAKT